MKEKARYFVYVLRLENQALYTGIARDVASRYREHQRGSAARYTRSFPPVRIAGCWEILGGRGAAMSVEAFIKSRTRSGKERLLSEPALLAREYGKHAARALDILPVDPDGSGGPGPGEPGSSGPCPGHQGPSGPGPGDQGPGGPCPGGAG